MDLLGKLNCQKFLTSDIMGTYHTQVYSFRTACGTYREYNVHIMEGRDFPKLFGHKHTHVCQNTATLYYGMFLSKRPNMNN